MQWLEELRRRRAAAEAYRRQGREAPAALEDETPPEDFDVPEAGKLFRNDSPGALTMEQAIARHTARLAQERQRIEAEQKAKAEAKAQGKRAARMTAEAEELAHQGRGNDTEIAHVALGELVLPEILQSPEVMAAVRQAAAARNIPFERLRVGSPRNSINPNTGAPEFGILGGMGDWLSQKLGFGSTDRSVPPATSIAQMPKLDSVQNMPFAPPTGQVDPKLFSGSLPAGTEPYRYDGPPVEEVVIQSSLITSDGPTNRKIETLHPSIRYDTARAINAIQDRTGERFRIADPSAYRSIEEQDKLYARGPIKDGGVTNAPGGKSYHNYGLAYDVTRLLPDGKTPDFKFNNFEAYAPIFKEHGFEWGGDWSSDKRDPPHFQRSYGYTTDQLREMMSPGAVYPTLPGRRNR
jgi:peptidoglycan L-alanyl-D-glutamate endopeptidase CwlK